MVVLVIMGQTAVLLLAAVRAGVGSATAATGAGTAAVATAVAAGQVPSSRGVAVGAPSSAAGAAGLPRRVLDISASIQQAAAGARVK